MSHKKQNEQSDQPGPARREARRSVVTLILVVAAFVLTYYVARHRRIHRLDGFAKCLAAKQVKMYGAFWCPHCADQEQLFEASFAYVPYVECGIRGSRTENQTCLQDGIKHFPTWEFSGGERQEGFQPLQALSQKTGCSLP